MNKNIFEVATREKFRFQFNGSVSVEDLWDLSVEKLDSVFKVLNSQVKNINEESLLGKRTSEDEVLDIKIEIVKYIVQVKLAEENLKLKTKAKKEQQQKIMSILSEKQDADLYNKSTEELKAMLDDLEN